MKKKYALSPLQQGMLFNAVSNPHSGVDIEQFLFTVSEPLDIIKVKETWNILIKKYGVLRTAFEWEGLAEPVQIISDDVSFQHQITDFSQTSEKEVDEKIKLFLREDRLSSFELSQAPLMRFNFFLVNNNIYKYLWTFHHIILDGRSIDILIKEFYSIYGSLINNKVFYAELYVNQYSNYIDWLQCKDKSGFEQFWRSNLENFSPCPIAISNNLQQKTHSFSEGKIYLSQKLSNELTVLAKNTEITLNSIFQGTLALLLHYYSNSDDIVFGTIRACRHIPQLNSESIVGLLINNIPVRIKIPTGINLLSWFRSIKDQNIILREFEHTALADINTWCKNPSDAFLFETLYVFENYHLNDSLQSVTNGKVKLEYFEQTNYPLTFLVHNGNQILLRLEYDESRFSKNIIKRMLKNVESFLQRVSSYCQHNVTDIPFLSNEELSLYKTWNSTEAEFPNCTLVNLFEKQAVKTPEKIAIIWGEYNLSYDQLNKKANQFAHRLIKVGIVSEKIVGLYLDRSPEIVIAMLGILKAGGAYLPLDPDFPRQRIEYMINDSKTDTIITKEKLKFKLTENNNLPEGLNLLCIDLGDETIKENTLNPNISSSWNNLAYVLYTSGSTGKPKGVQITNRSLVNFMFSMQKEPGIDENDILLSITTTSFDISGLEIYLPLVTGAGIVIAPGELALDPYCLINAIKNHNVTIMQATPTTWQMMLDAEWKDACNLKILCGGEALSSKLANKLLGIGADLWNMYGPTETTIWSTIYHCTSQSDQLPPIGKPIANTFTYIVNKYMQPVPVGATGELLIGGHGLARGYLGMKDATINKFITTRIDGLENITFYKTGDLAKFNDDGAIEYVGRSDFQVKIRGYRIEIGEIESSILKFPGVNEAIVIANDSAINKYLIAYIVANKADTFNVEDLKLFLKGILPDYMIPSFFISMEKVPLTPNNKVDRKALPLPNTERPDIRSIFIPPSTDVEKRIAQAWKDVLTINKIGIKDNFFDIGGNSILLMKLAGILKNYFPNSIEIIQLFQYPTIKQLSEFLTSQSEDNNMELNESIETRMQKKRQSLSIKKQKRNYI